MEQSVQALVQNEKGHFAVLKNADGEFAFPTCKIKVGESFGRAVYLKEAPLRVKAEAFLATDPETAELYYLFCVRSGVFQSSTEGVTAEWIPASEVIARSSKQLLPSVESYLGKVLPTREAA